MQRSGGTEWWDIPKRYGIWTSVYSHFRKLLKDEILNNIFRVLSLEAELEGLSINASIVQTHQYSAEAKGKLQMKSHTTFIWPK